MLLIRHEAEPAVSHALMRLKYVQDLCLSLFELGGNLDCLVPVLRVVGRPPLPLYDVVLCRPIIARSCEANRALRRESLRQTLFNVDGWYSMVHSSLNTARSM